MGWMPNGVRVAAEIFDAVATMWNHTRPDGAQAYLERMREGWTLQDIVARGPMMQEIIKTEGDRFHMLRHWLEDGWWRLPFPVEPIMRRGLQAAAMLQVLNRYPLLIDWVCPPGYDDFSVSVREGPVGAPFNSVLFLTPPPATEPVDKYTAHSQRVWQAHHSAGGEVGPGQLPRWPLGYNDGCWDDANRVLVVELMRPFLPNATGPRDLG